MSGDDNIRLLLSGGGTLGSVMPLLAVVEAARAEQRPWTFVWVGTTSGPERRVVADYGLPFLALTAGKWRRYLSWRNVATPLLVGIGWGQALGLLRRLRPRAVLTAGGFVSVPLVWAARAWRIPVTIHEQDARRGLANALMRPGASLQTSVWPTADPRTIALGNFVRLSVRQGDRDEARHRMNIPGPLPVALVLGGGTGALALNKIVAAAAPQLAGRVFTIHLTGYGKQVPVAAENYLQRPFVLEDLAHLFAAADVVVTRAGMAYLSELAVLKKPIIAVPLPHSPQEANAAVLQAHEAALVLRQEALTPDILAATVRKLLADEPRRRALGQALSDLIPDGTTRFLRLLEPLI